jgi:hypothetical protein
MSPLQSVRITLGIGLNSGVLLAALLGIVPAAAHSQTSSVYTVTMNFPNAVVWTVNGGPSTVHDFPFIGNAIALKTDGAGIITGSGWLWVDYSNAPYSAFIVTVSGNISSSALHPTPVVVLHLHGRGYSLEGDGGDKPNSIVATFTGKPGANPANTDQIAIVGKLNGLIHGTSPLGAGSAAFHLDAVIPDAISHQLILTAKVRQGGGSMAWFNAEFDGNSGGSPIFDLTGDGAANQQTLGYRAGLLGIGTERGWALSIAGKLGTYSSQAVGGAAFLAPVTVRISGRVQGQVISDSTSDIQAELITGN